MVMIAKRTESKTVLVLGYGGVGRALVWALRTMNPPVVDLVNVADPSVPDAFPCDVLTEPDLIRNYDYVINTIPVHDTKQLVPLLVACIKHGVHYLDTNEDHEIGKFVRLIGEGQQEVLFAPHSGLAPGLINVIGGHLLRKHEPETIDLRVGALTRFVDNDILYTPTWSPEGMVNQYMNDFQVLEAHGPVAYPSVLSRVDTMPIGHLARFYKTFHLDGIRYEAFPTSGGIGTLVDMKAGRVKSIVYQTIRLERHVEKMISLFNAFGFDREKIVKHIAYHRVINADDHVIVIAKADRNAAILRADSGDYLGTHMTAIQKCTVAGVAAVLDLHVQGKIFNGFLHQHDIDWDEYRGSRFFRAANYKGDRDA